MYLCKPVLLGLVLVLLVAGAGSVPTPADAQGKPSPETAAQPQAADGKTATDRTIFLNFKEADIRQIINLMSELTGKNFLVDDKVRGKVTIIAPQPVGLDEAYQVFLSILEVQGFTIVPQGPLSKIVPSTEVQKRPLPFTTTDHISAVPSDAFVTQLIPLGFADANDIRTLLSPLVSKESSLLAYAPTNTLILTELASNIARLLQIIRALDIETSSVLYKIVALRHATADKLADSLQLALEGLAHAGRRKDDASAMEMRQTSAETSPPTPATRRGGRLAVAPTLPPTPKTPTKIIPDSRTNSLLVIATPSDMAIADDLIAQLDVPTPEGRGQIHVHYLNHIDAEELASVLTAQATEITRLTEASASPGTEAPPRTRAQPGRGEAPAGSRSPKSAGTTPTGLTITAHKPTNSLLIIAPAEAYAIMKTIIEKLDIRRPQVLVESLIAEVSMDQTEALGVEWRLLDEPNGTQVFGSSLGTDQSGVLNTLSTNPLAGQPGLILGVLRHAITIGGKEVFNIPAVLRAVQGNTNVNVLANPNLLAIDNQEAQIIIGEERPFLRSTSQTPGGGVIQTARTFEFKDTGLTLRITPKVSQNKTVRLNLFLELTAFVSESEVGAVTTTKRSAQTSLIIDDGQTIIVGGLIQTDNNVAQNQVPCLGNVPLFGWLFKQTSTRKRKTNLLIFLTPHIIDTPDEARRITEHTRQRSEKADEIGEQLRQHQPQENRELLLD